MRRYGERRRPEIRYRLRPSVYAILPFNGQLLLTHQQEPNPEIQLPGGGIDPKESPLRALHREVFEETGWRVGTPRRVTGYRRFTYMPEYDLWAEKICHIYCASPVRQLGEPGEKGHTAIWADARLAPELLASSADADVLRQWIES